MQYVGLIGMYFPCYSVISTFKLLKIEVRYICLDLFGGREEICPIWTTVAKVGVSKRGP